MYCPWTGLGLYGGFRGNRWLRNRITIFQQFVVPSLQAQTNKNFILWCSWRPEEKRNPHVQELVKYLEGIVEFKTIHTFHGLCFWDDKYPDDVARERLLMNLHNTLGELTNMIGECNYVLMTIQPSDDLYHRQSVEAIQQAAQKTDLQAWGFKQGYMINYQTKEVAEYNPTTNPPFYTIKFPRHIFFDPLKHAQMTGPYKSHEYVPQHMKYGTLDVRGFMVGTHGENISTVFNHPFRGQEVDGEVLENFGIDEVPPLKIKYSVRKRILRKLPYKAQRKLRYVLGERFWHRIYEFLRS